MELLAALVVLVLLLATFVPYAMSLRETNSRVRCADNLKNLWWAFNNYAAVNGYFYPRVRFDETLGNRWTAFTGADDTNPFGPTSQVAANDVSASMWLLVREGLAKPEWFVCPSSWGSPDAMRDAGGTAVVAKQRGNFRDQTSLTYAYATPFSATPDYRLNSDVLPPRFVLVGDQGPSVEQLTSGSIPRYDAPPAAFAPANSVNHRGAGQNVLYATGTVLFVTTPYCGVTPPPSTQPTQPAVSNFTGDNIYTAATGAQPAPTGAGVAGALVGPTFRHDTYLVPGADFKPE